MPLRKKLEAQLYHHFARWTASGRAYPAAVLIGPRRTGTTSMYKTLRLHPNIIGASRKEIKFFNCNYWRGMDWYHGFFPRQSTLDKHDAITIEASPYYIYHPLAAERIREHFPEMKIIATLRNPIDRAYSHYHMNRVKGNEELETFEEAIAAERERLSGEEEKIIADDHYPLFTHMQLSYLAQGRYAEQLERWFSIFPREQIMVVNSEQFFTRMPEVFAGMIDFLGLPPWRLDVTRNANPGSYTPISPETREQLVEYFRPHNQRLYELLDEDFGWDA